jgi:hypothetical protein
MIQWLQVNYHQKEFKLPLGATVEQTSHDQRWRVSDGYRR